MDLSNVTAAKKGTTDILRIYQNDIIVYNKYNWEKWNVNTTQTKNDLRAQFVTQATSSTSEDDRGLIPNFWRRYENVTPYSYQLCGATTESLNYINAYNQGFRFVNPDARESGTVNVAIGDTFWQMVDCTSSTVTMWQYMVVSGGYTTTYSKGTTSYGAVQGYAGDYPDNGKQGNYWYVKVTA